MFNLEVARMEVANALELPDVELGVEQQDLAAYAGIAAELEAVCWVRLSRGSSVYTMRVVRAQDGVQFADYDVVGPDGRIVPKSKSSPPVDQAPDGQLSRPV